MKLIKKHWLFVLNIFGLGASLRWHDTIVFMVSRTQYYIAAIVSTTISWLILVPLYAYRILISPFLGQHCRFYPSCSVYAIAAVRNHGIIRGLFLSIKRLLKCHPWHSGGVDPVPASTKQRDCS